MVSLKFIFTFLIFIVAIHAIALYNHWYWTYLWLDIPMHFLGGILVAMIYLRLINSKLQIINRQSLITLILTLSFVTFVGVLLEFAEFLYDVFISSRGYSGFLQLGAADTIADLFFDILGGLFFSAVYFIRKRLMRS
ncbi:MAG: hypothetical protein M1170_02575 [Patescibacteria group bacterium]|nr:hypothetical protein [Patescibacteria group bacterium]